MYFYYNQKYTFYIHCTFLTVNTVYIQCTFITINTIYIFCTFITINALYINECYSTVHVVFKIYNRPGWLNELGSWIT